MEHTFGRFTFAVAFKLFEVQTCANVNICRSTNTSQAVFSVSFNTQIKSDIALTPLWCIPNKNPYCHLMFECQDLKPFVPKTCPLICLWYQNKDAIVNNKTNKPELIIKWCASTHCVHESVAFHSKTCLVFANDNIHWQCINAQSAFD